MTRPPARRYPVLYLLHGFGEDSRTWMEESATSSLSKALAERAIPHVFEIYEGGEHGNKIRGRLETRLFRFFSDKLDAPSP